MNSIIETIFSDQTLVHGLFLMAVSFALVLVLLCSMLLFSNSNAYKASYIAVKLFTFVIAASIFFLAVGYFVSDSFRIGLEEYALAYWISLQTLMI